MQRREFITSALALAGTSLATPALARCQTPRFSDLPVQTVLGYTKQYRDWYINPTRANTYLRGSPIRPNGSTYWTSMKGRPPIKFLQYEKQPRGINLGWTNNAHNSSELRSRQFFMAKRDGSTTYLRYGERFALAWNRPSKPFIVYQRRKNGINLVWSSTPRFEWTFLGGGPNGRPVRHNHAAVLFNTTHNMPMHYFERTRAGHIGWPDSKPDFWQQVGTGTIIGNPCPQQLAVRALQYLAQA